LRDSTGNRRAARPLLRCRTTQTLHEGPPCNHRSVVVRGYNDARQRHSRRGHGITWRGTGGAWRPHQCFSFSGGALGGCQPPPHHRTPWGVAPRRLPVSSLGSPVRGSRLLAPVALNRARRVRGRRRWVNPFALANEQTIVSIPSNQGVGRPGHGSPGNWIDPAGKESGCESHRRAARNCRTPATHAGRQSQSRDRHRCHARSRAGVIGLPCCEPGCAGKQHGGAGA